MKVSERLSAIAGMVTPGNRLADVGCDHAYIPIELCLTGRIPSAVAMDVKPGPLERAEENISASGLDDRIETRQSDGLEKLGEDEADTVLIAGMGGLLTARILTKDEIPVSVTELVLAPQSEVSEVRKCVRELGFRITDEDMVLEDGKFYPIIKAKRAPGESAGPGGSDGGVSLPETEDAFGPVLLAKRHPVLLKWLMKENNVTDNILSHLERETALRDDEIGAADASGHLAVRVSELEHKKQLIAAALERYE